jgi:hypothetical protein
MDEDGQDREHVSLADLAAEANRRRRRKTDHDMLANAPWWARMLTQFGIGAAIAAFLVNWMVGSLDRKMDLTLEAAQQTRAAQVEANRFMSDYAQESARQAEIMLLVQRQTCANVADLNKNDEAKFRCFDTKIR